jgi:hypothetical protein
MIGRIAPKPSQTTNSATRIGRIGDQSVNQFETDTRRRWANDMGG